MNMAMEDYVLSESQMKKVLEMGFGPTEIHEHSSMMFVHFPNPYPSYSKSSPILTRLVPASGEYYGIEDIDYTPTMTSEDLEKLLPRCIESGGIKTGLIEGRGMDGEIWKVCYQGYTSQDILHQSTPTFEGTRKVDVLLDFLGWCVKEKYIIPKPEEVVEPEIIKEGGIEFL